VAEDPRVAVRRAGDERERGGVVHRARRAERHEAAANQSASGAAAIATAHSAAAPVDTRKKVSGRMRLASMPTGRAPSPYTSIAAP